mmetsp:Transcript_20831/g.26563  ORF Transcript_20831/g.26563 Transcript_20831/m.26563 type:complete len:645 (+) Transcript_20831:118-2052(+)|eukprot:CAMPEP_0204870062 /NCGR_PEP_ID=MMETSP1348-20121228/31394_1 /ASSEMBLY_ACC=CAM_ASM_000700 /TAXON_ID=215587 /ORGANISM="Aplanochytrium stocchinoi, Strain GSBS06" /LENGTH=644 /DNA_ID=CAMNT_0052023675 /DNA_START=109 /DNA_END=2043 /DNA_ORIENTATION=-
MSRASSGDHIGSAGSGKQSSEDATRMETVGIRRSRGLSHILRLRGGGNESQTSPKKDDKADGGKTSTTMRRKAKVQKEKGGKGMTKDTVAKLEEQAKLAFDAVLKFKNMIPRDRTARSDSLASADEDDASINIPEDILKSEEEQAKENASKDKLINELKDENSRLLKQLYKMKGEIENLREAHQRIINRRPLQKKGSLVSITTRRYSATRLSGMRTPSFPKDENGKPRQRRFGTFTEVDPKEEAKKAAKRREEEEDDEVAQLDKIHSESLKDLPISVRDKNNTERSGFRLLLESDVEGQESEIRTVKDGVIHIPHLTKMQVKLKWCVNPGVCLIIKRLNDEHATKMMIEMAKYLKNVNSGMTVLIESPVVTDLGNNIVDNMTPKDSAKLKDEAIDFIICLGGDGTLIWACSLFPEGIPPIVSFKMGSLGFLSPFSLETFEKTLDDVLTTDMETTIRSRLEIRIERKNEKGSVEEYSTEVFTCLNEVVVDRGPYQSMVQLNLYSGAKKEMITVVQGDGIIVATPTGSTAYSLAAGGSIIHPATPGMVVTPIAPHSLSFRPIVVADSTFLMLEVPDRARNSAFVSFDGQHQKELKHGDRVRIMVSEYPVSAYCEQGETADWFNSIKASFLWNERTLQRAHSMTTTG